MLRFTLNGDILVTKRRIDTKKKKKKKRHFRGEACMQLATLAKCISRVCKYEM